MLYTLSSQNRRPFPNSLRTRAFPRTRWERDDDALLPIPVTRLPPQHTQGPHQSQSLAHGYCSIHRPRPTGPVHAANLTTCQETRGCAGGPRPSAPDDRDIRAKGPSPTLCRKGSRPARGLASMPHLSTKPEPGGTRRDLHLPYCSHSSDAKIGSLKTLSLLGATCPAGSPKPAQRGDR